MTPYERIVRAANRGTGCRLSAEDTALLADDHAISYRASMDAEMALLPEDERAHYECFTPAGLCRIEELGSCSGDGWYRCEECAKYDPGEED